MVVIVLLLKASIGSGRNFFGIICLSTGVIEEIWRAQKVGPIICFGGKFGITRK